MNMATTLPLEPVVALPDPLTPADCNLRDFKYMPLDVVRFRDSDFTALTNAEAFRAGVILWAAAWHQVPAGSLPDDDRLLSNLAGFGRVVKEWKKYRAEALHGWVKCNDGRLYHPVICEKARESWASKNRHAYDKLSDRLRKSGHRIPSLDEWLSVGMPGDAHWKSAGIPPEKSGDSAGIPAEKALKGKGEGKVKGENIITPADDSKTRVDPAPNPDNPAGIPPEVDGDSSGNQYGEYQPPAPDGRTHRKTWAQSGIAELPEEWISAAQAKRSSLTRAQCEVTFTSLVDYYTNTRPSEYVTDWCAKFVAWVLRTPEHAAGQPAGRSYNGTRTIEGIPLSEIELKAQAGESYDACARRLAREAERPPVAVAPVRVLPPDFKNF